MFGEPEAMLTCSRVDGLCLRVISTVTSWGLLTFSVLTLCRSTCGSRPTISQAVTQDAPLCSRGGDLVCGSAGC